MMQKLYDKYIEISYCDIEIKCSTKLAVSSFLNIPFNHSVIITIPNSI